MSTWNGIGTKYLGFSFKQSDGSHFATEWIVFSHLPVIPLQRHQLVIGDSHSTGDPFTGYTDTATYRLLDKTGLRLSEILATYLAWWIVIPALAMSPFLVTGPLIEYVLPDHIYTDYGDASTAIFGVLIIATVYACVFVPIAACRLSQRRRQIPL